MGPLNIAASDVERAKNDVDGIDPAPPLILKFLEPMTEYDDATKQKVLMVHLQLFFVPPRSEPIFTGVSAVQVPPNLYIQDKC